ncbi:DUF6152 family protein [Aurantiacibacter rhizosphaerae]|uniref:Copper-binding protein n=1 Tax=Aurantiacibacter rhizosphaerae TaxID=2691582 RepID=A0A844XB15_9SPHN|nr:DUF6152 family protein [Aurantiacibacter rhizosphaerae]MWV27597.1 hypothetical protein [Aurantiacibacter rhizosphaerae]
MRIALAVAAALLVPIGAGTVAAHHSMAMFDNTREVTVRGTVKQFQWSNPHAYIQMVSTDAGGRNVEWSMEMGSPMYLYARGWRPRTLRPGTEVTVRAHPLRSGKAGGVVLDVVDADGRAIGSNQ